MRCYLNIYNLSRQLFLFSRETKFFSKLSSFNFDKIPMLASPWTTMFTYFARIMCPTQNQIILPPLTYTPRINTAVLLLFCTARNNNLTENMLLNTARLLARLYEREGVSCSFYRPTSNFLKVRTNVWYDAGYVESSLLVFHSSSLTELAVCL